MGRTLILLFASWVLFWLLRRAFRRAMQARRDAANAEQTSGGPTAAQLNLVACAQGGVLVPQAEAISANASDHQALQYCCVEHQRLGPGQRP